MSVAAASLETLCGGSLWATAVVSFPGEAPERLTIAAAGVQATVRVAGSGVQADVFADASLSGAPLEQPIVSDADGRLPGYVAQPQLLEIELVSDLFETRTVTAGIDPVAVVGPPGPQGDPGPQGGPGPEGAVGPAGPPGPAGPEGAVGPQGAVGPAGAKGDKGDAGVAGPEGPAGAVGPAGPEGAVGPAGPAGVKGDKGDPGTAGAAGPAGPQGDVGPAGPAGPAGAQGPEGVAGPAGPAGAKGDPGAAGPQGATGPAGPNPPYAPQGSFPSGTDKLLVVRTDDGDDGASRAVWQYEGGAWVRVSPALSAAGKLSASELPSSVAIVSAQLPASNGADDTATINAAMAALAAGGCVKGKPGETYLLGSPLKLPTVARWALCMDGCQVAFANANVKCNMLQSGNVTPLVTAGDCATTQGQAVVVSPTLAAQAQPGQQVAVVGAGPAGGNGGGPIWLYGTVSQVVGNNITLTGNVNGVAASQTLAGATGYLFGRAAGGEIYGGLWNSGTNWNTLADRQAAGFNSHLLRIRREDRLTVRGVTVQATGFPQGGGWAFGINPGDCTDLLIDDCEAIGSSTLVQGDGPLAGVTVRNMRGQSQDDMVAMGCVGFQGNDVEGDISGLLIDGIWANGSWRAVDVFAGQGGNGVQRVLKGTVRSVKGSTVREGVRTTDYAGAGAGPVTLWTDDITVTPGGGFAGQSNGAALGKLITATGAGGELGYAPIVAGQSGIGAAVTDINNLTVTITAPASGAVILEAWVYSVQQATNAGVPVLYITDSANAIQTQATAGNLAVGAFSPSVAMRKKLTGLTPGQSYTFKVRASVAAGSMGIIAGANNSAFLRALAA